jgi:hypothetical protein
MHEVSHQTGKKQFDFDEFLLIMVRKESFSYSAGKVIEAFKLLDNSNDGQISRKVLSEILRGIPKGDDTEMNEAEIYELIKGVLEKNEKADKNEKMYNQQNSMYEKSDKNDKEKDDETLDYNKLVNTVMTMLQ